MLGSIWSPSGGLRYHLRARRHREHEWLAFREALEAWFADWQPRARTLAIVGPSGGYCLPLGLVARFPRVLCFEPDPVARLILARRLRALPGPREVTLVSADVWIKPLLSGGGPPTVQLGQNTALLFSNFIGQVPLLVPDEAWERFTQAWRVSLWPLLERIPWASFHDRVSGSLLPDVTGHANHTHRLSEPELAEMYSADQGGELLDHRSQELLPEGVRYGYLHWPLYPGQEHLIECTVGGVVSP